jgi:endonuclease/exonuclease/phosphatase family metal-dependent hydrolase
LAFGSRPLWLAILGSWLCAGSACESPGELTAFVAAARPYDGTLSLLTYNVEGAPWPFALDRPRAFVRIAARLRALRRVGRSPGVAVLQEAFTADAQAIGHAAGYRYVVEGPGPVEANAAAPDAADLGFAADARWWLGETQGKLLGSGLLVLSDYPIVRIRRMAFPAFACAGFDCLANKGALLVTVRIPGASTPIDIVTTHLNSRHNSHAGDARSLYAYAREAAFLSAFINRWHDPADPLIVAGDFNAGVSPPRWVALRRAVASWRSRSGFREALTLVVGRAAARGMARSADVAAILRRAADWQFFTPGTAAVLDAVAVQVPFGREPQGGMLSDHIGYAVRYRLERRGVAAS